MEWTHGNSAEGMKAMMMTQPPSDFATFLASDRVLLPRTVFASLLQMLAAHREGIRTGRSLAARYHALAQMSRSELANRGLTRQDISRVVAAGPAA